MKATSDWRVESGADFSPGSGFSGYADLSHYTARYCTWGEGPPLVLIPGLAGGFELLGPLAQQLARRFTVISYQLRGEDDCFALRQRFGLPDLVEDLREFLEWMGLEAPPIFGVSFGGVLALEFATRWPNHLQALAVQGTGPRFERTLLQRVAGMVLSGYPLPADSAFVNQFFNLLFGQPQHPGPLFQFVTRQVWQTDQGVMSHRFRMAERFDVTSRLARVRVPSLVFAGQRDLLVSARSLQALADGLPQSRLVRLPDCGHLAFVTRPQQMASAVFDFLSTPKAGCRMKDEVG